MRDLNSLNSGQEDLNLALESGCFLHTSTSTEYQKLVGNADMMSGNEILKNGDSVAYDKADKPASGSAIGGFNNGDNGVVVPHPSKVLLVKNFLDPSNSFLLGSSRMTVPALRIKRDPISKQRCVSGSSHRRVEHVSRHNSSDLSDTDTSRLSGIEDHDVRDERPEVNTNYSEQFQNSIGNSLQDTTVKEEPIDDGFQEYERRFIHPTDGEDMKLELKDEFDDKFNVPICQNFKFRPKSMGINYSGSSDTSDQETFTPKVKRKYVKRVVREKKPPKKYLCTVCNRTYPKPSHLARHFRVHTGEKPYECEVCCKRFNLTTQLKMHLRRHTGERPYKCHMCDKDFTESGRLREHIMTHSGIKPNECPICGKCFSRTCHLRRHTLIHTGERPYACETCDKRFNKLDHLARHRLSHGGVRPFQCDLCEKTYLTNSDLVSHRLVHTGERPFMCDICGSCFFRFAHLMRHRVIHTGEKPYPCVNCGKSFARSSHLARHRKLHTKPDVFSCYACEENFPTTELLKLHAEKHDVVVPPSYACNKCGMEFVSNVKFSRHMKKHVGDKRIYECDICPKAYKTGGALVIHKRSHTGEKPYFCEVCAVSFSRSSSLVRHKRSHSGEKPHHCSACGKDYVRRHLLLRHMLKHHPNFDQTTPDIPMHDSFA